MTLRSPRPFRFAALVTSITAAAAALACGGRGDSEDALANPGAGATAETPGLESPSSECTGGEAQGSCDSPAAAAGAEPEGCPASIPAAGSDCDVEGLTCSFRTECIGYSEPDTATCRFAQWLIQYPQRANCDPLPIPPACPQRAIVVNAGCAFEGQICSREVCLPEAANRQGHQCFNGSWRAASLSCPIED